jgi:hypothetical protein
MSMTHRRIVVEEVWRQSWRMRFFTLPVHHELDCVNWHTKTLERFDGAQNPLADAGCSTRVVPCNVTDDPPKVVACQRCPD